MMAQRRWINTNITAGYCYWSCPGSKCEEVFWWETPARKKECICTACGLTYKAVSQEDTRLLIEVIK